MAAPLRRPAAAGYRRCVLAAAILISAVAVMFAVVDPDPVTSRLLFSSSSSIAPASSRGPEQVNSFSPPSPESELEDSDAERRDFSNGDLKAPPLQSEEQVDTDAERRDSSNEDLKAPPLQSEEQVDSETEERNSTSEVLKEATLQSEPIIEAKERDSSGEYVAIPPSQSPELTISSSEMSKAKENFLRFAGEDSSQPEVPIRTDGNEVKSSNGDIGLRPLQPEKPVSLMTATDQELIFAKEEIGHAPVISNDPDLYAPLFRNVAVFKRSYELMERTLKVYIYRDGRKPIFHTPFFKGIYASEGWFLKLMEANTQFVVKDPNKAHLFFLPYSARQLEETLYKPDSHNLRPLAVFLKNYIDGISVKYPFWNRTRGADHFLVACHDWGPYTTKLHEELRKNAIKALCNADLSEGFVQGKDVSLPETNIRNPRRPLRGVGGKPVSRRSILAFFAGNLHGRVRPILLEYWSGKDEDMKIYGPLPPRVSRKMSYIEHMKSSKFCICPMGYEVNSPRIVEAIYYECVPVIIADNFVLPFDDVLDWSRFSVVVAEKDIPNLKDILMKISPREYATMQNNVKRVQRHFLWHQRPVKYDIFHMILHSIWFSRLNQIQVQG
ncbi:putative glycosyltransferase [Iris pallida]|uniref:Glycosyltransferase n=1 Tax=Iris pallida TaxID=29817 RepID=A0AAX6HY45_IRIPA|nr:putative glycosyltransferase [Iris pallida]